MLGQQRVQLRHAGQALRQATLRQPLPMLVDDRHIVMGLGPVVSNEDHPAPLPDLWTRAREEPQRPNGSVLKAARHPTSHLSFSPTDGGTI
jgi:hypothetical protein